MSNHYVTPRVAAQALGVHTRTLTRWEAQGKIKAIRTAAGQRRYDLEEYLRREGKRCAPLRDRRYWQNYR